MIEAPAYEVIGVGGSEVHAVPAGVRSSPSLIVEDHLGNLLDVECIVVEVLDLQRVHPGGTDEQSRSRSSSYELGKGPSFKGCAAPSLSPYLARYGLRSWDATYSQPYRVKGG